jgi:hypothetical protein
VLKCVGVYSPKDRQAHLPTSVDIRVETRAPAICSDGSHAWRLRGVFLGELDGELEEAELVWGVWWSYDQRPHMPHVDVAARNSEGEVGAPLNLAQLASDPKNALIRHGVAKPSGQGIPRGATGMLATVGAGACVGSSAIAFREINSSGCRVGVVGRAGEIVVGAGSAVEL